MLRQVVASHEFFGTIRAGEFFLACMCPIVSGQFVRPGEPLATLAFEWFFAGMSPPVAGQVGFFAITLGATLEIAHIFLQSIWFHS